MADAYQKLAENILDLSAEVENNYSKTCSLHYVSASHGGWGIVRMAALVPEAHLLFVCPSACGKAQRNVGASWPESNTGFLSFLRKPTSYPGI